MYTTACLLLQSYTQVWVTWHCIAQLVRSALHTCVTQGMVLYHRRRVLPALPFARLQIKCKFGAVVPGPAAVAVHAVAILDDSRKAKAKHSVHLKLQSDFFKPATLGSCIRVRETQHVRDLLTGADVDALTTQGAGVPADWKEVCKTTTWSTGECGTIGPYPSCIPIVLACFQAWSQLCCLASLHAKQVSPAPDMHRFIRSALTMLSAFAAVAATRCLLLTVFSVCFSSRQSTVWGLSSPMMRGARL